MTLDFVL